MCSSDLRVIVLGGGNTAMDCCRTARRLGGESVKVIVRSGFDEMKASPWEKEDAMGEDIPILNMLVPKEVKHENGRIKGVVFEEVDHMTAAAVVVGMAEDGRARARTGKRHLQRVANHRLGAVGHQDQPIGKEIGRAHV